MTACRNINQHELPNLWASAERIFSVSGHDCLKTSATCKRLSGLQFTCRHVGEHSVNSHCKLNIWQKTPAAATSTRTETHTHLQGGKVHFPAVRHAHISAEKSEIRQKVEEQKGELVCCFAVTVPEFFSFHWSSAGSQTNTWRDPLQTSTT